VNTRHRKALSKAHQRGRSRRADERHSVIGRLLCSRGHADLLSPSLFEAEIGRILEDLADGNTFGTVRHADADIVQRTAADPRSFYMFCRRRPRRVREWIAEMKTAQEPQIPGPSRIINQSGTRHGDDITTAAT
jgi:hypothetical protein